MIKLEKTEVLGWEAAIRGMRNPMNSWEKSDSYFGNCDSTSCDQCYYSNRCEDTNDNLCMGYIGPNDLDLMLRLAKGGPVHAKYRRFITVTVDITAPLYWWKEFDTYKVGTVANSCSTMHKIHEKEFTLDDFSCEHLENCAYPKEGPNLNGETRWVVCMDNIISSLNVARQLYLDTGDKKYWWQMIQLLPSSYNQRRTIMLNYEVLAGLYLMRKDHKLDEWRELCKWIEGLPYSEIITLNKEDGDKNV